jgi:membrane protein implicated in regulation of membrane protease activity
MPAWIWLVLGILSVVLELLVPSGFFLFILGLAGLAVGVLSALGVIGGWVPQVIVFCSLAIVFWIAFGNRLSRLLSRSSDSKKQGQLVGAIVTLQSDILPGGTGQGELWGSQWTVENIGSESLAAGSKSAVVASQGIKLQVRAK